MFLDYLAPLHPVDAGLTLMFLHVHLHPRPAAQDRQEAGPPPHEEAIHVACWLSLLTIHAMWPFIFIWAVMHARREDGAAAKGKVAPFTGSGSPADLEARLGRLESRLRMAGVLDADGN